MWFFIGYKLYIEYTILENNISLLYSGISFLFGIMLFLNYIKFITAFFSTAGVLGKMTLIVNFILLNTNYGIFDITKYNKVFNEDIIEGANYYVNILFVILNFLPFIANRHIIGGFTKKYMVSNLNSMGCLTLFILTLKHDSIKNSKYYFVVEILCCLVLFIKFISDYVNGNMTVQNVVFFILFMINTYLLFFLPVELLHTPEVLIPKLSYQGFLIRESLFKDAGIEGFYGLDLFVDENMRIADKFIEIGYEMTDQNVTNVSSDILNSNTGNTSKSQGDLIRFNIGKLKLNNISSKEFRNIYPKHDLINIRP